ncbi:MAG: nitrous oxide reductase accessory protein NosL [Pseudomonadota bacterium]
MTKILLVAITLLTLTACREDEATNLPAPVAMTAEAVGHYCQMNILEHPGPKAQIHLDGMPHPLFFSQVRDAVAYQRMPEQSHAIRVIYVSDMSQVTDWNVISTDNWIPAISAHYVVGSSRVGGMGAAELVPFSNPDDATRFAKLHGGQVMSLDDIADVAVLSPVAINPVAISEDDDDYRNRLKQLRQGGEN